MEIKFKKLFKTTLLYFVVFVMIFNSFAAISVSDGSAFVTKAEFSADLNNLSNRMSALENSIDAKIDSLVSSYLSRNGIWNGEKQTLTDYHGLSNYPSSNALYTAYKTGQEANLNYLVDSKTNGASYDLVTSFSKSGLAHVVHETSGQGVAITEFNLMKNNNTIGTNSGYSGIKYDGTTFGNDALHKYFRDFIRYKGSFELRLYLDGYNVYSQEIIGCSTSIEEALYPSTLAETFVSANWTAYWSPKRYDTYFFVTKGQKLTWNIIYSAVYAEIFTGGNPMTINSIRGSRFNFSISNISVY